MKIERDETFTTEMKILIEKTVLKAKEISEMENIFAEILDEFKLRTIEQFEEQVADLCEKFGGDIRDYVDNANKNVIAFTANLARVALAEQEKNSAFLQIILMLIHDVQLTISRYVNQTAGRFSRKNEMTWSLTSNQWFFNPFLYFL